VTWPFVWLAGAGSAACLGVAVRRTNGWTRVAMANLGLVLIFFAAIEVAFGVLLARRNEGAPEYPAGYFQSDDILGAAPPDGAHAHVRKQHGAATVYDVVYTIGANGLRVAPPDRGAAAAQCVLFFGDSFTFGEGLADDQTLPYRVGVLADGNARVFNFGFHGYGAQQMLAALERGDVESVVGCRPTQVIYEGIPDHVARAAGFYNFMQHWPRYELVHTVSGDSVRYAGHFDDRQPSAFTRLLQPMLSKSWLYRWLVSLSPLPGDADLKRYVAIVRTSERLVTARYPGCHFDVLWWSIHGRGPMDEITLPALRAAGLRVHATDDILPGFRKHSAQYTLSPYDGHPSARADDLLARYVVKSILGGTP
jgi:hypothetical protein